MALQIEQERVNRIARRVRKSNLDFVEGQLEAIQLLAESIVRNDPDRQGLVAQHIVNRVGRALRNLDAARNA